MKFTQLQDMIKVILEDEGLKENQLYQEIKSLIEETDPHQREQNKFALHQNLKIAEKIRERKIEFLRQNECDDDLKAKSLKEEIIGLQGLIQRAQNQQNTERVSKLKIQIDDKSMIAQVFDEYTLINSFFAPDSNFSKPQKEKAEDQNAIERIKTNSQKISDEKVNNNFVQELDQIIEQDAQLKRYYDKIQEYSKQLEDEFFLQLQQNLEKEIKYKDWDSANQVLYNAYCEKRHQTMSLFTKQSYYSYETLQNPHFMQLAINQLSKINPPQDQTQNHEQLIRNLKSGKINKAINQFHELQANLNSQQKAIDDYIKLLIQSLSYIDLFKAEIVKKNKHEDLINFINSLPPEIRSNIYLEQICQYLNSSTIDAQQIISLFKQFMTHHKNCEYLIPFYSYLSHLYPQQLYTLLPQNQFLQSLAPQNVQGKALEFFNNIKQWQDILNHQQENFFDGIERQEQIKQQITQLYEQLFYEENTYALMIREQIEMNQELSLICPLIREVKSMKEKRNQALRFACEVILGQEGQLFFEEGSSQTFVMRPTMESQYVESLYRSDFQQLEDITPDGIEQMMKIQYPQNTIQEFLSIDPETNYKKLLQELTTHYKQQNEINIECLEQILFDLFKKRYSFEDILIELSNLNHDLILSRAYLLNLICLRADHYLRTMLFLAWSQNMPIPLMFPKINSSKDQNSITQYQINEELFYVFEKYKGVFSFKLSTNPNKIPQGSSTLLNEVFLRDFGSHQSNYINYGTIEIQFDSNFEKPKQIPIADAHGLVDIPVLEKVYPLFDIFIIHSFQGEKEEILVHSQIQKIKQLKPNAMILNIVHSQLRVDNNYSLEYQQDSKKLFVINTSPLQGLDKQQNYTKLKKFIYDLVDQECQEFNEYTDNIRARLQSMEEYRLFLERFNINTQNIKESQDILKSCIGEIIQNQDILHTEKFLPLNFLQMKICENEKQLFSDAKLSSTERQELYQQQDKLQTQIRNNNPGSITQILKRMIEHGNYVGLTSVLGKLIRSYLSKILAPLYEERQRLERKKNEKQLLPQEEEQNVLRCKELSKEIESRFFSFEFIMREQYLASIYKGGLEQFQYFKLASQLMAQMQPFEIISGENLQFVSEVFNNIDPLTDKEDILVVSVLGPQSSGKSLLLNSLFGVMFFSSAARCTRGVYGSLINLKNEINHHGKSYTRILLLDSEGIDSQEGRDEGFDQRIIFFLLSVSHVVLICNKQEMNKHTQTKLKLACDSIANLRETIIRNPQVNIIMNIVPHIEDRTLEHSVNKLRDDLLEISAQSNSSNVNKIFNITQDNVFILPLAYEKKSFEGITIRQSSRQFADLIEPLKQKILNYQNSHQNWNDKSRTNYTFSSWINFAVRHWSFTQTYSSIILFKSIQERQLDIYLASEINSLINSTFCLKESKDKNAAEINKRLQEIIARQNVQQVIQPEQLQNELESSIKEYEKMLRNNMLEILIKIMDNKKAPEQMQARKKKEFKNQFNQHIFEWKPLIQEKLQNFCNQNQQFVNNQTIKNKIVEYLRNKQNYTEKEASEFFELEWQQLEKNFNSRIKQYDTIQRDVMRYANGLFLCNSFDSAMDDYKEFEVLIKGYKESGDEYIDHWLKLQRHTFFYFTGNEQYPSYEKFIKFQFGMNKQYLTKVPDLFEQVQVNQYYNWLEVLQHRFKFQELSQKLHIIIMDVLDLKGCFGNHESKERKIHELRRKLDGVVTKINTEGEYFGVETTPNFQQLLDSIEQNIFPQKHSKVQNNNNSNNNINQANECVHFIMQYLQHTLAECFKYKEVAKHGKFMKFVNDKIYSFKYEYFEPKAFNPQYINVNNRTKKFNPDEYLEQIEIFNGIQQSQQTEGKYLLKSKQEKLVPKINKNKHFEDYLKFIACPEKNYKVNKNEQILNQVQQQFFSYIDWNFITKQIQELIQGEIRKNPGKFIQETIFNTLLNLLFEKDIDCINQFFTLDNVLIQKIVEKINQVIQSLDQELDTFCLKVSVKGKKLLILLAQTYITSIYTEINWITERSSWFVINKTQNDQRTLFIARLTSNDDQTDKILAQKAADDIIQYIINDLKPNEIKLFQEKINYDKDIFKMQNIQRHIEDFLLKQIKNENQILQLNQIYQEVQDKQLQKMKEMIFSKIDNLSPQDRIEQNIQISDDEAVRFYVDPKIYLKEQFDQIWKKLSKAYIGQAGENYKAQYEMKVGNIILFFTKINENMFQSGINEARELFYIENRQQQNLTSKIEQNLQARALSRYLSTIISPPQIMPGLFQIDNYILKPKYQIQNAMINQYDLNQIQIDPKIIEIFKNTISDEPISIIQSFLKHFIYRMKEKLRDLKPLTINELEGNYQLHLREKILGCQNFCPLCRKQCDQDHEGVANIYRIHKCQQGHQIQGFGGNVSRRNKNAITYQCLQLLETDLVYLNDQEMTWEKYKEDFYNRFKWSLEKEMMDAQYEQNQYKNMFIWNYLGQKICNYYNQIQDLEINFVESTGKARSQEMQHTHYILILDQSSSMGDIIKDDKTKWHGLIKAVKKLLSQLEQNPQYKVNSKVSILVYNGSCRIIHDQQKPSQNLIANLGGPDGNTNFSNPILKAYNLVKGCHQKYDLISMAFLSDGEAAYPKNEIDTFTADKKVMEKIKFTTIGYGIETNQCLKDITKAFRGTLCDNVQPNDLYDAFVQLIPNMYEVDNIVMLPEVNTAKAPQIMA